MRHRIILAAALAAAPAVAQVSQGPKNVPGFAPAFENQTRAPDVGGDVRIAVETVADGLDIPWGLAALPGGGYLVTERPGTLRPIGAGGEVGEAVAGVPEVDARRQGGLLDVALAADFAESRRIYLTYAKPVGPGRSATALATGVLSEDATRLDEVRDLFVQTPPSSSPLHYGSRVVVGDGVLYVTTGERSTPAERVKAQDLGTTYGKVIRLAADGTVPGDNPFIDDAGAEPGIFSYGHRNPQGAALRPGTDQLWTIEHGPKGGDELNLIRPGANYGWPEVSYGVNYSGRPVGTGEPRGEGYEEPVYYWDPVIAPGDITFYDGDLFDWQGDILAGSLNPGGLVRLELDGDRVTGEARYLGELGRIRDVAVDGDGSVLVLSGSDGALYRLTPAE